MVTLRRSSVHARRIVTIAPYAGGMFVHRLLRRPATRAQAAVELALAALLAAQPVLWIWMWNAPGQTEAVSTAPAPAAAARFEATADPFFPASARAPLAPHTLFAVRTGGRGGAILAGPDGMQKAVAVGEAVSEGVTLAGVAQDHVILAHHGARTRLDFPAAAPSPASVQPPSRAAAAGPAAPGPGAADAATYATALRPVSANGADGYIWRPGVDGGVLAEAGLRPGDVILRINGTPFDRAERMEELAVEIAAGSAIDLEYKRNGVVISSRYTPS